MQGKEERHQRPLFFDLSELFFSSSKFKYYGISRVVAEIAFELHKIDPGIQFVAFSPGHRCFIKLRPNFSQERAPSVLLDINVPVKARPIRARLVYYRIPKFLRPLLELRAWLIRKLNCRRWDSCGLSLEVADLKGATLVAMGRPKLIAEYMDLVDEIHGLAFVPLLHDVIPLSTKGKRRSSRFFSNFLNDNNRIIESAAYLLANSFFTKNELLRFEQEGSLRSLPEVRVLQLAHECRQSSEPVEKRAGVEKYLLCVGSTLGRKNLDVVLDALVALKQDHGFCPPLVLAGTVRKRVRQAVTTGRYKALANDIRFVTDPNQAELISLYQGCLALVLPSFIEGWGLPAGEALWLGRPALCSDIPVLHEVCGKRGIYFDPRNPQELARRILGILEIKTKEDTLPDLYDTSRDRLGLRSWFMVAQALLDITSEKPVIETSARIEGQNKATGE